MISRLYMVLEANKDIKMSYQKAVILQGIMMEQIENEYASALHESKLHPYSQYVTNKNGENIWVVNTLNEEAYKKIAKALQGEEFNSFKMEHDDLEIHIVRKEELVVSKREFMRQYYFSDSDKYIEVVFNTPTAFKSQGIYVNYPNLELIYKSLMNKYDSSSENEGLISDELREELVKNTRVMRYDLHSCNYNIGNSKIPSFMGKILLRIDGAQGIVNFANMLFRFGEYAGIGIKTAMGMGSIKLGERCRNDERKG